MVCVCVCVSEVVRVWVRAVLRITFYYIGALFVVGRLLFAEDVCHIPDRLAHKMPLP